MKPVHFHCVSHGNFNTVPHACTFHALLNITEFEVMKRGFCGSLFPFSVPASSLTCLKQRQSRKTVRLRQIHFLEPIPVGTGAQRVGLL